MPRQLHKLNALQVSRLAKPGRHSDGGGLYLSIGPGDRKRWVFIYRDRKSGKLREMGLGAFASTPLAKAREKAARARALLTEGHDPIAASEAAQVSVPTFGECADAYVAAMSGKFRNEKHKAQWRMTLTKYAAPLRTKPVDTVTVSEVVEILRPLWGTRPETASRLRGRIERVLDAAKAAGHRQGENPARWRGHLDHLLPARQKLSRGHHRALPWMDAPAFMSRLRQETSMAARCLEFAILTAARSGEARGARWAEIDLASGVWIVPADRMKAGREHRVPLGDRAREILAFVLAYRTDADLVFPGQRPGRPLSDAALAVVLRRLAVDATPHGFRSTFRDWASEASTFPSELAEMALAHIVGDATERAYRRGDALEKRRAIMEAWAGFCKSADAAENVVRFARQQPQ